MELVTSVSAILIAIAALIFAVIESRRSRAHFRHSIRPALVFELEDGRGQLVLRNAGLGPAAIENAEIYLDGRRLGPMDAKTWSKVLKQLGFPSDWAPGFLGFMFFSYVKGEEDSTLSVGGQWAVVDSLRPEEEMVDLVVGMAARLKIVVQYTSLAPGDELQIATWDGLQRLGSLEDFDLRMAAALSLLDSV